MIGIDLGTTNSCVAVMEGGAPQVIPNQEGARTTPSVVAFTANGERLVGELAKRQAATNPRNTLFAVHRLIGRRFDSVEVEQARRLLPYHLIEAPDGGVQIQIEDRVHSAIEIVSFVLWKLKAAAEDYLGEPVEEAIITHPAYFNDSQRQATKDAGLIALLKVSRMINGPTAAALAYGLKQAKGQFVAVYDLGGGTFDISILELAEGLFQVRATGGDTYLGGEDFDQRIIDWLIAEFMRETRIDIRHDPVALARLREAAEKAKCELSTVRQTEIVLPFISADASGPKQLKTVLTRQQYESLTDDLLERTIEPCRRCLADAGLRPDQIDEVLLVGGQTRAPKVSEIVRRVFGREPSRALNPDEVVAMGAAVQAGIIAGEVKELVLLDVTPHSLGIETKDGTFTPLIDRNSTIPTRQSRIFTTVADNQTHVELHVLQGESDMAAHNWSRAKFELTDIPPAPKGRPQIEVTFEMDVNGIVSVAAQYQATGRSRSILIHPSGGWSPADTRAALHVVGGQAKGLVLADVTPHSLGVETKDGTFTPIIERNTAYPTTKARVFTNVVDGQAGFEVHVLQGESDMAADNKSLARFELTTPPAPKGASRIEVTFVIHGDGILTVSAREQATGGSQSIVIHPSAGLTHAESGSKLGLELVESAPERQQRSRKDQDVVIRQLDGLLANTMRSVQALEGKLNTQELERILGAIERAQKAREQGDLQELKASLEDMEEAASLIGQAMLRP